jgi:hypothetical protein
LTSLQSDGWQINADRRHLPGTESTISLTHPNTPPRLPLDVLKAAQPASADRPPARRVLGAGYSITDPEGAAREHEARLKQITDDLLAGLSSIALDSRLSDEGKAEAIQQARSKALSQITTETEAVLRAIQTDRGTLEQQAHVPITPSADEAVVLLYTRDSLRSRWETMSNMDIETAWQNALTTGDQVAVRVYRDFAPQTMRQRPPWNALGADKAWPPRAVSDLLAASDRALMSADQRSAVDRLKQIDIASLSINGTSKRAHNAAQGAKIDPRTNQVKDHLTAAADALIRSSL